MRELELMDDLIENSDGTVIGDILGSMSELRNPDDIDENEADAALKIILAQLAMFGIALDMWRAFYITRSL